MNKIQFHELLEPLVTIYDDIELDLLKSIIEMVDNYSGVKGSLKWYLDKLKDIGILDKRSLEILTENKDLIKKTVEKLIKEAGSNKENYDLLNSYYEKGLLNVNPLTIYDSVAMNNIINNALKDCDSIMDLIQTKAIEGTNKAYKDILNKSYIETASGVYTYTESIRRALNEYANKGIAVVHYANGRTLSIEAVVRRDVITRVNKLNGDLEIQQAKELGTNLVYVSQHLGARVRTPYMKYDYEAHAEWQGKKYMIEGSSVEYPNLYEATGYGEMLGLKGINCYHDMRPTWTWEIIEERIDEVENKDKYEHLQKQRAFERKIRSLKRRKLIAKQLNDKDELTKINKKLSKTHKEFNDWLKENSLTRDYNREYVADIKINQMFEDEYFKEFENLNKAREHLIYYDYETGKQVGKIINGERNYVKTDVKTTLKILLAKKDSIIAVHNHPSNLSFSLTDFQTFNNTNSLKAIAVRTDDYIYLLSTGKGSKLKSTTRNMDSMEKVFRNIEKEMNITSKNKTIDNIHLRNAKFAKEMGWKYGRIRNKTED